jgi:hypothetical protein
MKFYNIFKPHIVEFADGTFAVRKRGWLGFMWTYKDCNGWRYSSTSNIQWWLDDYLKHCKVKTYEAAVQVMALRKPPYEDPNQVIKVYHET